jgi:hypothetical protein
MNGPAQSREGYAGSGMRVQVASSGMFALLIIEGKRFG